MGFVSDRRVFLFCVLILSATLPVWTSGEQGCECVVPVPDECKPDCPLEVVKAASIEDLTERFGLAPETADQVRRLVVEMGEDLTFDDLRAAIGDEVVYELEGQIQALPEEEIETILQPVSQSVIDVNPSGGNQLAEVSTISILKGLPISKLTDQLRIPSDSAQVVYDYINQNERVTKRNRTVPGSVLTAMSTWFILPSASLLSSVSIRQQSTRESIS